MQANAPAYPLVTTARCLLLINGVGIWIAVVQSVPGISWYGWIGWLVAVPIALAYSLPHLITAIRGNLWTPSRRTGQFLLFNACLGLYLLWLAFKQSDPEPHLAIFGAASVGAGLLVAMVTTRKGLRYRRLATTAVVLAMVYMATYALPTTIPAVAAIHLEGVVTIAPNTISLVRNPSEEELGRRPVYGDTFTVDPGTYTVRIGCSGCTDGFEETIEVRIGQSVVVPGNCPG